MTMTMIITICVQTNYKLTTNQGILWVKNFIEMWLLQHFCVILISSLLLYFLIKLKCETKKKKELEMH